jgi:hypothetical protein
MQTLHALDLTESKFANQLWRRRHDSRGNSNDARPIPPSDLKLPVQGFPSPFGYWFAESPSWTNEGPRLTVEFSELDERERASDAHHVHVGESRTASRTIRTGPKAPAGRARNPNATIPLSLEIDSNVARIGVGAATWEKVGETVLFTVAQYWRFAAINRALDELSDWARNDLERSTGFIRSLLHRRARALRTRQKTLQKLILDLPDYEGSLTNPRGHLPSRRAVGLYRRLCVSLGLNRQRREIDERIEVVESIFDSLTESLNHSQSLAFQIVLELAIVALLLLDVGLYFFDAFF